MDLLGVLAIVLLPLIPAVVLFVIGSIPRRDRTGNSVQGTVYGFKVRLGGASALYFIVLFVLLKTDIWDPPPPTTDIVVTINVVDTDVARARNFIDQFQGGTLRFSNFSDGHGNAFVIGGFEKNPGAQRMTATYALPSSLLNQSAEVSVRPQFPGLSLKSKTVRFSRDTVVEVQVKPSDIFHETIPFESGDWITQLGIVTQEILQDANCGDGILKRVKSSWLVKNESNSALAQVTFTDNRLTGRVARESVSARHLSDPESQAAVLSFRIPDKTMNADADKIFSELVAFVQKTDHMGNELGYFENVYGNEDGVPTQSKRRGKNVHLVAENTTIRIGPLEQPVAQGESVFISYLSDVCTTRDYLRVGSDIKLGHLLPRPSRLTFLAIKLNIDGLKVDPNTATNFVQEPDGNISLDHPRASLRTTDQYLIGQYQIFPKDTKVQIRWAVNQSN